MIKKILVISALVAAVAMPTFAEAQTEKQKCTQSVEDVRKMRASSDAGPRANKEADELIEVAQHLCTQGNFVYADKLMEVARGLLTTE